MNRTIVIAFLLLLTSTLVRSQSNNDAISRIPLLGEDAPVFNAESTLGPIEFPTGYGQKWKILFSHPADFTPVCTSELMELSLMQQEFKDMNVALAVVSTDALERHYLWKKSIEEILSDKNTAVKVKFPLIDDSDHNIGLKYGMLTPSIDSRKAVRGVFIIDPQNKIQSISFYPLNVGRNLNEIKRTVIALQTARENTVLTPANWVPGDDVLLPYPESHTYYNSDSKKENGTYDVSGYMLYKKLEK